METSFTFGVSSCGTIAAGQVDSIYLNFGETSDFLVFDWIRKSKNYCVIMSNSVNINYWNNPVCEFCIILNNSLRLFIRDIICDF